MLFFTQNRKMAKWIEKYKTVKMTIQIWVIIWVRLWLVACLAPIHHSPELSLTIPVIVNWMFGAKLLPKPISIRTQITRLMWPTWGPPGSCRPQVGPIWPHEPCYQGLITGVYMHHLASMSWRRLCNILLMLNWYTYQHIVTKGVI